MKTAELTGALLDYWVAKAEGFAQCWLHTEDGQTVCFLGPVAMERFIWAPSTAWEQGGPIIERERIAVLRLAVGGDGATYSAEWCAFRQGEYSPVYFDVQADEAEWRGPTALIAAMRAYVASKFGEEVPE